MGMPTIATDVAYIAFTLSYNGLGEKFSKAGVGYDEAYDYCLYLAKDYLASEYEDEDCPINECVEAYINAKAEEIDSFLQPYMGMLELYRAIDWHKHDKE